MPIKKKKISELTLADSLTGLYTIGCKIIDGIQTSVKVSLEVIQKAYEDMLTEISNARAATKAANTAAASANAAAGRAETAAETALAANQVITKAETGRVKAEQGRVEAEKARVIAETERSDAEKIRKEAEDARIVEETLRKKAESIRQENESMRQDQEEAREEGTVEAILNVEKATDRLNTLSDHRDEIRDGYWWRWNEETGEWYNTGEIAKGNVMYATFSVDPETAELAMFTDEEYTGASFALDENGILSIEI